MQVFLGITPYTQGLLGPDYPRSDSVTLDVMTYGEFATQDKLDAMHVSFFIIAQMLELQETPTQPLIVKINQSHLPKYGVSSYALTGPKKDALTEDKDFFKALIRQVSIHNQTHHDIHSIGFYAEEIFQNLNKDDALELLTYINALAEATN